LVALVDFDMNRYIVRRVQTILTCTWSLSFLCAWESKLKQNPNKQQPGEE
jgi:hypothetical protein